MPRSENYSTDSVQSFKSNFREHLHAPFPRHVDVIGLIDTVIECFDRTRFAKSCAIHDG